MSIVVLEGCLKKIQMMIRDSAALLFSLVIKNTLLMLQFVAFLVIAEGEINLDEAAVVVVSYGERR